MYVCMHVCMRACMHVLGYGCGSSMRLDQYVCVCVKPVTILGNPCTKIMHMMVWYTQKHRRTRIDTRTHQRTLTHSLTYSLTHSLTHSLTVSSLFLLARGGGVRVGADVVAIQVGVKISVIINIWSWGETIDVCLCGDR